LYIEEVGISKRGSSSSGFNDGKVREVEEKSPKIRLERMKEKKELWLESLEGKSLRGAVRWSMGFW